ncbi:MAG: aminopeptidase P family protein [Paludibacteraceae bacterium]|nr:aminopeptidase P family protein [Paludibacteraceae bacterium]
MTTSVPERLALLRKAMQEQHADAYIIPSTDPHASEYIADCWKERPWISGFTGSAGEVVVTAEEAFLWTDSRYFLQAGMQLEGSGIGLMKDGIPGTPSVSEWLAGHLHSGQTVAINPEMISVSAFAALRDQLAAAGIALQSMDLIGRLWNDRPDIPLNPCFILSEQYSGKSAAEKIQDIRHIMQAQQATAYVISSLDELCWLLNLRGSDVKCTPVVIGYVLVEQAQCTLFIDPRKLTPEATAYLTQNGVQTRAYSTIFDALRSLPAESSVLLDDTKLNEALYEALPAAGRKIRQSSPVTQMKAVKNTVELEGVRRAMKEDGKALVRFFMWLEKAVQTGQITEFDTCTKLREFRAQGRNFVDESFTTIAGYGPNGAIVHYDADEHNSATLRPTGMFLLDSGGQYLDGTTDITRTICFDAPSEAMRHDYTLVLKGHIDLALAQFPEGTRGNQLDVLARQYLWNENLSYGHGTGHGVGHFLCVHEGPQNIRTDNNPTPLRPGMIISDEPGLYRAGQWGIRIENLIAVQERTTNDFARFYGFEVLTLFPYHQPLIDWSMLNERQTAYINHYHEVVYRTLAPELNEEEQQWLAGQCRKH